MLRELMFANFHWKDFMLLECYVLEDVGSMTFCYTLEGFMPLGGFYFMKLG